MIKLADFLPETAEQKVERESEQKAKWDETSLWYRDWAKENRITLGESGFERHEWVTLMLERAYKDGPIQVYYRCLHIAIAEIISRQSAAENNS